VKFAKPKDLESCRKILKEAVVVIASRNLTKHKNATGIIKWARVVSKDNYDVCKRRINYVSQGPPKLTLLFNITGFKYSDLVSNIFIAW
jgi:hypothetical protein